MEKASKEREQTDKSLSAERKKADKELAALDDDADQIVHRARRRANTVVATARAAADEKRGDAAPPDALKKERHDEDVTLRRASAAADRVLGDEREARQRALSQLLRYEREDTDQHLGIERVRADAAIASRDNFLGMVSHDVRTLLGGMAMSAEALTNIPCEGVTREQVEREALRVRRYTARMNRLIGDLLDVVSIEAGKLQIYPEPGQVSALVRETLEAFEPTAITRSISLTASVSPKSRVAVFDHGRILQVLANLVSNALKFTPSGGDVSIAVDAMPEALRFRVIDSGPGIESDKLGVIFERFAQAVAQDRRGLGIGLFISKCIVEAHGGRIWADSRRGGGSAFSFTLPTASRAGSR